MFSALPYALFFALPSKFIQYANIHVFVVLVTNCMINLLDSPADRSDLQINDEILEVNGVSVVDATHTDVIMQIHKVYIRSTIQFCVSFLVYLP